MSTIESLSPHKMRSTSYPRVPRALFCSALLLSQHAVVDANNWATGRASSSRSSTLAVMQPGGRNRPIRNWKAIKRCAVGSAPKCHTHILLVGKQCRHVSLSRGADCWWGCCCRRGRNLLIVILCVSGSHAAGRVSTACMRPYLQLTIRTNMQPRHEHRRGIIHG